MLAAIPLLLPLFCLIVIAAYYAVIFKRRLNETCFLSAVSIILILYLFGLLNFKGSLLIGYGVIVLGSLIALLVLIRCYLKNRAILEKISFKTGLLQFFILAGLSLVMHYGRVFVRWDEFSHWGTVVKHMNYYDALATIEGSTLGFKSYIPGTALFQYFFTRPFDYFTEYPAYIALNILVIVMVLPFASCMKKSAGLNLKISKKNCSPDQVLPAPGKKKFKVRNIIVTVLFLLIPLAMYPNVYHTLYVDSFLGIAFGAVFLYYFYYRFEESFFGIVMVTAALGLLTLIKHVGLILAAVALGVMVIDCILFRRTELKNYFSKSSGLKEWLKKLSLIGSPVFIVLFIQVSWRLLLTRAGIGERWSLTAKDIMNLLQGDLRPYQVEVWNNYILALVHRPLLPFNFFSYYHLTILAVLLAFLFGLWLARHKAGATRPVVLVIIITLCSLSYAAFLLVAYMFSFSEYEAVRLASYNRYILSYLIGLILSLLIFILELPEKAFWNEKTSNKYPVFMVGGCIFVFVIWIVFTFHSNAMRTVEAREPYNQVFEWSEFIAENSEQRIGFIAQESKGYDGHVLNYMIYPYRFSTGWKGYSFAIKPYYPESDDPWTSIIEPEDWGPHILDNYNFMYLFRYDKLFKEAYGHYFDVLITGMIYEVRVDADGKLELVTVGD